MNKSILSCLLGISLSAIAQTSSAAGVPWVETTDASNVITSPTLISGANIGSVQGTLNALTDQQDNYSFLVPKGQSITLSFAFFNITATIATANVDTAKDSFNIGLYRNQNGGTPPPTVVGTSTNNTAIFTRSGRTQNCGQPTDNICSPDIPATAAAYAAIVPTSDNSIPSTKPNTVTLPSFTAVASLTLDTYFRFHVDQTIGNTSSYLVTFSQVLYPTAVPEPGSFGLMGMGLAAAYLNRRRRLHG